jgi:hypothetical protein
MSFGFGCPPQTPATENHDFPHVVNLPSVWINHRFHQADSLYKGLIFGVGIGDALRPRNNVRPEMHVSTDNSTGQPSDAPGRSWGRLDVGASASQPGTYILPAADGFTPGLIFYHTSTIPEENYFDSGIFFPSWNLESPWHGFFVMRIAPEAEWFLNREDRFVDNRLSGSAERQFWGWQRRTTGAYRPFLNFGIRRNGANVSMSGWFDQYWLIQIEKPGNNGARMRRNAVEIMDEANTGDNPSGNTWYLPGLIPAGGDPNGGAGNFMGYSAVLVLHGLGAPLAPDEREQIEHYFRREFFITDENWNRAQ